MAEALPEKEKAPEFEPFDDPEVETLTANYRRALTEIIGPLEAGYLRVLNGFLKSYQDQKNETAVEQIQNELVWIKAFNWREGFTHLSLTQPSGELPSKLTQQRTVFLKEFEKRFQPIQRTYLSSLNQMQTHRISKGRNDVEEIKKAIKKIENPEGAARARFVKIESLPDEGINTAAISTFDILDFTGEKLPHEKLSIMKASSSHDKSKHGPEKVIDGDPTTRWATRWKSPKADFPHWLTIDLGDEHWISGFQLTPREARFEKRDTDITNWRFYISLDGKKWTPVAKGDFPQGAQMNEHRGFEKLEEAE